MTLAQLEILSRTDRKIHSAKRKPEATPGTVTDLMALARMKV